MSIATEITQLLPHDTVEDISMNKSADLHGQKAVRVKVVLNTGQFVEGNFATESKEGFGGVDFSQKKDVAALMVAKIKSVLAGTAE